MNDAVLFSLREIADAMNTEPADWEWVGPFLSQRMFGITEQRAKGYAARHGGVARKMAGSALDIEWARKSNPRRSEIF